MFRTPKKILFLLSFMVFCDKLYADAITNKCAKESLELNVDNLIKENCPYDIRVKVTEYTNNKPVKG